MKNKKNIVNISLTVVLALCLASNFIMFNQFYNSKQTRTELQTKLKKGEAQIQTKSKILQANRADAKLLASKLPSDPNEKLSCGITLREAKLLIDDTRTAITGSGMSAIQIQNYLKKQAGDLGTTLDEINRLPAENIAIKTPETQAPETSTQTSSTPSTGGNTGGSPQPSSNSSDKTLKYVKDKDGYTIPYNSQFDYDTWVKAWNSVPGSAPTNVRADISDEKWILMWKQSGAEYQLAEESFKSSMANQPPDYGLGGYVGRGWVKTIEELPQRCSENGCYKYDDGSMYKEGTSERKERSGYYCTYTGISSN